MSFLGSSSGPAEQAPPAPAAPAQAAPAEKPKPCCVCKTEKTARDDCMLFSKSDDPTQECKSTIDQYKACMAGFGFKV
ncbi:Cytochrome c oxidase copper chaperone [Aspergillus melleus]|uniref:Cytochrome c oxidase copper chaperone n=1 Tax=Aspergillus melleus TaxID=138277 RepID=A0ACC3AS52_9EURO|nr:Cytochrome c oxidase copper chaperone [Aspergillus melleus]